MSDRQEDDGVIRSYKFAKSVTDEHQRWIEAGYFEDDVDLTANAFGMLRDILTQLENDRMILDFNKVIVEYIVELPENFRKHMLN